MVYGRREEREKMKTGDTIRIKEFLDLRKDSEIGENGEILFANGSIFGLHLAQYCGTFKQVQIADEVGVLTTDNVYLPIQAVEVVDDRINLYRHLIAINGKESQCRMAMEECAELIQAINKCLRYPTGASVSNLSEEIADTEIMIAQLKLIFNIGESVVEQEKNRKLGRMSE